MDWGKMLESTLRNLSSTQEDVSALTNEELEKRINEILRAL